MKRFLEILSVIFLCSGSLVAQDLPVFPVKGVCISDTNINFSWNSKAGAVSYELQLASDAAFSAVITYTTGIASTNYLYPDIPSNATYHWRVRSFDGSAFGPWEANAFTVFRPTDLPGLKMWLVPDSGITKDGSGKVSLWKDYSGGTHDFTQGTAAAQPTYVFPGLGSKAALSFDGNDLLQNTTLLVPANFPSSEVTCIVLWGFNVTSTEYGVYKTAATGIGRWRYSDGNGYQQNFRNARLSGFPLGMPTDGIHTAAIKSTSSTYEFFLDAANIGTAAPDFGLGGFMGLGMDEAGATLNGRIGEVITYRSGLTPAAIATVDKYLRDKFFPPVNLGKNISFSNSFCPITLRAGKGYDSYIWSTGSTADTLVVNSSGKYFVTVTDKIGRVSSDTVVIDITRPVANILSDFGLCAGAPPTKWNTNLNKTDFTFLWNDASTDSLIVISSPGSYSVTITDKLGCKLKSDTVDVYLDNFATTATLGPDVVLCEGNYLFLLSGASPANTYLWSPGGSTNDSLQVFATGEYRVQVTNGNGCVLKDTVDVTIAGKAPSANFSFGSICLGDSVSFVDLSVPPVGNTIASWTWNFGEPSSGAANVSSLKFPKHKYAAPGTYTVSLLVETNVGCKQQVNLPVVIYQKPVADFIPHPACKLSVTQFEDQSLSPGSPVTSWRWKFGDPASLAADSALIPDPVHQYNMEGTYTVRLIVRSLAGCSDTVEKTVTVMPALNVRITNDNPCFGAPIGFRDETIVPFPWSAISRSWSMGDGNYYTIPNLNHSYTTPGTYTVSLTVKANNGCVLTVTKNLKVTKKPLPDFTFTNNCVGDTLRLTDKTNAFTSAITKWNWSIGSTTVSTATSARWAVNTASSNTVKLKVVNVEGCTDSVSKSVVTRAPLSANFIWSPNYASPGQNLTLIPDLDMSGVSYTWTTGGTVFSNLKRPVTSFADTGSFKVTLQVQDSLFCKASGFGIIPVSVANLDLGIYDQQLFRSADGYVSARLTLINFGNRDIHSFEIKSFTHGGNPVKEKWTGLLKRGDLISYQMVAEHANPSDSAKFYLCTQISSVNGRVDDNVDNNDACKEFRYEQLIATKVYPSPTTGEVNLELLLPEDMEVIIDVYNNLGQKALPTSAINGKKGLNMFYGDLSSQAQGLYTIRIRAGNEELLQRIYKN